MMPVEAELWAVPWVLSLASFTLVSTFFFFYRHRKPAMGIQRSTVQVTKTAQDFRLV